MSCGRDPWERSLVKETYAALQNIASHAGVFILVGELVFLPSPQTPAQRKTTFLFSLFYLRGIWPINNCAIKCWQAKHDWTWPWSYRFPSFLSFAKVMQCTEYSKFWRNLAIAALNLTFIGGQKAFPVFNADRVIIRLPCGQGQLSRIWKVQCDWLSLGKECCLRLSRHLWGGMKNDLP